MLNSNVLLRDVIVWLIQVQINSNVLVRTTNWSDVFRSKAHFATLKGTSRQRLRNQRKIPTQITEVGKNKLTIRHLYHENIS